MCDPADPQSRKRLYHVCLSGFPVGADILPGHFGYKIRSFVPGTYPIDGNGFKFLMWEMALETARWVHSPNSVSRLDCVFAWENIEQARTFRDMSRPGHTIYEVEPETGAELYRGDFGLLSQGVPNLAYVEYMPAIAAHYWRRVPGEHVEVLVGGVVKVVAVVE